MIFLHSTKVTWLELLSQPHGTLSLLLQYLQNYILIAITDWQCICCSLQRKSSLFSVKSFAHLSIFMRHIHQDLIFQNGVPMDRERIDVTNISWFHFYCIRSVVFLRFFVKYVSLVSHFTVPVKITPSVPHPSRESPRLCLILPDHRRQCFVLAPPSCWTPFVIWHEKI